MNETNEWTTWNEWHEWMKWNEWNVWMKWMKEMKMNEMHEHECMKWNWIELNGWNEMEGNDMNGMNVMQERMNEMKTYIWQFLVCFGVGSLIEGCLNIIRGKNGQNLLCFGALIWCDGCNRRSSIGHLILCMSAAIKAKPWRSKLCTSIAHMTAFLLFAYLDSEKYSSCPPSWVLSILVEY